MTGRCMRNVVNDTKDDFFVFSVFFTPGGVPHRVKIGDFRGEI